jgi:hypothetical protein
MTNHQIIALHLEALRNLFGFARTFLAGWCICLKAISQCSRPSHVNLIGNKILQVKLQERCYALKHASP